MARAIYFSEIIGKNIFGDEGKKVGSLNNLVFVDGEEGAEITHFITKTRKGLKKFAWVNVASVGKRIFLKVKKDELEEKRFLDSDLTVNEVLLDKQLVDTDGLKVIRVNDILLVKEGEQFFISSVAVGARSFLRRLGIKLRKRTFSKIIKQDLVPWSYVQPLSLSPTHIALSLKKSKINKVHPADIADLMEELSHSEREILFGTLDEETAAETLVEAEPEVQKSLFRRVKLKRLGRVLKRVSPDEMADFITVTSGERFSKILRQMDERVIKKVKRIVVYPHESAGGIMHTEFIAVPKDYTVAKTINFMRKMKEIEEPFYIYVVDREGRLVGVLSPKRLMMASPRKKVSELMEEHMFYVNLKASLKKIAKTFSKYHVLALPVVDREKKLVGTVLVDDVFEEIVPLDWKKKPVMAKGIKQEKKK